MSPSNNRPSVLLDATRLRERPPRPFRWVDPRLLQEGRLENCRSSTTLALYLILILAGNQHGISYYGEKALCRLLGIDRYQLRHARGLLIDAGLIAYQKPYYQVLSLDPPEVPSDDQRAASQKAPPAPPAPSEESSGAEHTEEKRKEILTMLRQFREEHGGRSGSGRS